jgi:hypothetical protein
MIYDYFLETNKDNAITGTHRIKNAKDSSDEFLQSVLTGLAEPESTVVHVDAVEYYRFVESPEYLPAEVMGAMQLNSNQPHAEWNQAEKRVEFFPLLKLDKVESCEYIEGVDVSNIIGDVPGLYRVTGAYPVIRFKLECVCHPGEKKEAEKEKHTLDIDDFTIRVSTGNNILLPNKEIRVHVSQRAASGTVALTVPNPKTNLMMVSVNHKKALLPTQVFHFVWNEG